MGKERKEIMKDFGEKDLMELGYAPDDPVCKLLEEKESEFKFDLGDLSSLSLELNERIKKHGYSHASLCIEAACSKYEDLYVLLSIAAYRPETDEEHDHRKAIEEYDRRKTEEEVLAFALYFDRQRDSTWPGAGTKS